MYHKLFAICFITAVMSGCGALQTNYLPATVPHDNYLYGPLARIDMDQRRDLALYCKDVRATYSLDNEACAFSRGETCYMVYLRREGIGGEHEKQLIAICNGWHPRIFAQ
jgi:hypothetical protein